MSRLWRQERAQGASSVGSFVVVPRAPMFRPWSSQDEPDEEEGILPVETEADRMMRAEADAYARGLADARRTVEAELAAERDALTRLAESLETLRPEPSLPLAMLLAETVDRLVRQVVGEVEIDGLRLLERAKAAAALVAQATEPARLRLHPADAALLADAALDVVLEADPTLERGALVVETADGWIEDSPAIRLERLRAELDKLAATR